MTIEREHQLDALKAAGRVVRQTIEVMQAAIEPGMTSAELDDVGRRFCEMRGARSAPQLAYSFPGFTCISINDEAVHGIPGSRVLRPGDLVKIDVALDVDGYIADACSSSCVPPATDRAQRLIDTARSALEAGVHRARPGELINRIGRAVEREARRRGAHVLRELGGHGVGRSIHEAPSVASYYVGSNRYRLPVGLVFTIEPIVAETTESTIPGGDGWTVKTFDGCLSAQFEHTLVVTRGRPLLLTA